ncbi:phage tail tip fiber protein [Yersinia mollaretii]|uniref:phage tail tip fiber protein n=1 Tax=Yersinia mollaretii TaxID=33060 RepID=UPI0011A48DFA|nr:DUF1983 domain-containing protein [Yersinia mollaretii]
MSKGFRAGRDSAALAENIEVLTGQRGDGQHRAVTYAEMAALKLAKIRTGVGGKLQLTASPHGNAGPAPAFPMQPKSFNASGGFGAVLLEWDRPHYRGHALTEIYRSTEDNLANAVMVASSAAAVYGDPVDPGWQGYYWIRFINAAGVAGPFNATEGTPAKTAADIDEIINLINHEINASPLIDELTHSVNDLDQHGGQAFQKMWSTKVDARGITAGIGIVAGRDAKGKPLAQVAISASQFFIFDPSNPTDVGTYAIPFSVSDGRVIIDEAAIRDATLKILRAQTIVADEVKAGIRIDTPTLNSATINNGKFTVDAVGNLSIGDLITISHTGRITIRFGKHNIGLVITNERIEVYDENGVLMLRLGKLDDD